MNKINNHNLTSKYNSLNKTLINLVYFILLSMLVNITYAGTNKSTQNQNHTKDLDKIVAIVNDDVITNSELNKKIRLIKQQMTGSNIKLPPENELRKQVINKMVSDFTQLQIAQLNNVEASATQVDEAINNILKQNNTTIYSLRRQLSDSGISFNDFKEDIKQQLTIMAIQQAVAASDIKITKRELEQTKKQLTNSNAKNSYRLSQILVSVPNSPSTTKIQHAKQKANEILDTLKKNNNKNNNDDFAKTAQLVSDGPNALKGGDLGWFDNANLPTIFANIVPKMKKNELYGPIQSESGYHIVKLTDINTDANKYKETQYRVRHILIKPDEVTTSLNAKKELEKLRKEIINKKNFEELALIYSEDIDSASKGGDIGWISSYVVVPEFAKVVESLNINEISKPFKSPYGWHIVQLLDKKIVDSTDKLQEQQARQIISSRKFQDAVSSWQQKIQNESVIKILI